MEHTFDIYTVIVQISVLVFSVVMHEVSHGFMDYKLGDPTAKDLGRLTLNPLPHIDPMWSILIPAILIFTHSGVVFGAAKPVPFDPRYFKHQRRDIMLTSLAGPVSNLLLAAAAAVIMILVRLIPGFSLVGLYVVLIQIIAINIFLAIFNLVPIPPLDGSKVLAYFLPPAAELAYMRLQPVGMIILIALAFTGTLNIILSPIAGFVNALITFLIGI